MLTAILQESGQLDWAPVLSPVALSAVERLDTATLLGQMRSRLRAEEAARDAFTLRIVVRADDGATETHRVELRRGILVVGGAARGEPSAELRLSRATLSRIGARVVTWADAAEQGEVEIHGSENDARRFLDLIE